MSFANGDVMAGCEGQKRKSKIKANKRVWMHKCLSTESKLRVKIVYYVQFDQYR